MISINEMRLEFIQRGLANGPKRGLSEEITPKAFLKAVKQRQASIKLGVKKMNYLSISNFVWNEKC